MQKVPESKYPSAHSVQTDEDVQIWQPFNRLLQNVQLVPWRRYPGKHDVQVEPPVHIEHPYVHNEQPEEVK